MKAVLMTLAATMALATAAFAGPGDQRAFPYGPVPIFADQGKVDGAPYSLTGSTSTSADALRPNVAWIGGARDRHTFAAFADAR